MENQLKNDLREVGPNKYVRGQIGTNFSEAGFHHKCAAPQDVCSADKPVQLLAAVSWRRLFCAGLNLSPERPFSPSLLLPSNPLSTIWLTG
jgi:hypothetical protein